MSYIRDNLFHIKNFSRLKLLTDFTHGTVSFAMEAPTTGQSNTHNTFFPKSSIFSKIDIINEKILINNYQSNKNP